jgi:hypothetical protein
MNRQYRGRIEDGNEGCGHMVLELDALRLNLREMEAGGRV